MVLEASAVGILNRTECEQWEGCVEEGVWMCCCLWRLGVWGYVIVKQKESCGAVTVPGRTQDNSECNGVLNGKSSVFRHRFNVIASFHSAMLCYSIQCFSLSWVFFIPVFCACPNFLFTPAHLKSNTLLFLWFKEISIIFLYLDKPLCSFVFYLIITMCRAWTHLLCVVKIVLSGLAMTLSLSVKCSKHLTAGHFH